MSKEQKDKDKDQEKELKKQKVKEGLKVGGIQGQIRVMIDGEVAYEGPIVENVKQVEA